MKDDGPEDGRMARSTPLSPVEEEILKTVRRIRYGSVEITIHDSRVVQIEQKEKVRIGGEGSGGARR